MTPAPFSDAPFLEWTATRVAGGPPQPMAMATTDTGLWVAGAGSCALLATDGSSWREAGAGWPPLASGVFSLLPAAGGRLWAALAGGLARYDGAAWHICVDAFALGVGSPLALAADGEGIRAGFAHGWVARLGPDGGEPQAVAELPGAVRALLQVPEGHWLAATDAGIFRLDPAARATRLADVRCRTLCRWDGGVLAGTADGLLVIDPDGVCARPPLDDGLPVRDVCHLLPPAGPAPVAASPLWAGTPHGLLRHDGERWHYHQGPRWLPDDGVLALAAGAAGVYVATPGGLARLAGGPVTLEQRARLLDQRVRERHLRLDAFVCEAVLPAPGEIGGARPMASDNDGLWTAMYLAAQSYRFAATGAAEAAAHAHSAFDALERLEAVTTIPGYPTKAIFPAADGAHIGDRTPWYPSADGRWVWKGDCSSDEIVGHMYGYALYHDLVAGPAERARVAALITRIMGHILDNGLRIMEFGRRTRWGYWNPEAVNGEEGMWGDRGLNSLEILSHLRVASTITGDTRHEAVYAKLVERHGYARNTLRAKVDLVGHVNHSDDELAFLAYDPLLRYERDPALRATYIDSLRRSWAFERPERNPLWNFIYTAHTGDTTGLDPAVRSLRELPTDTVNWPVRNTHRADVALDPWPDRHGRAQLTRVLPYDELPVTRWNGNPYQADGGNARVEGDGVHYLLPYWMGRYHGWIAG